MKAAGTCSARDKILATAQELFYQEGIRAVGVEAIVEAADVIMIIGANPTDAHPVFASHMKRRLREGARLIILDPRRIDLVKTPHIQADYHLPLLPGTNVAMINSLAHVWGSRPYATGDESRNNALLAVLTLGEGWHNNHHHYQRSERQGFYWWELDITHMILRTFSWARLVRDLHEPPRQVRDERPAASAS